MTRLMQVEPFTLSLPACAVPGTADRSKGEERCSCFDKPVLRKLAVSFDRLRTNGQLIEGLSTNGFA